MLIHNFDILREVVARVRESHLFRIYGLVTIPDHIHINPVKHALVDRVADWPYSTFHRLVEQGVYDKNWAGSPKAGKLEYED